MANKDFKVKNKLIVSGISNPGPLTIDASGNVDSTTSIPTQYGGTGTTTSPTSGQILYSASGTNYAPSSTSVVYPPQSNNSGKYLTTDGTNVTWGTVTTDSTPQIFMLMGA